MEAALDEIVRRHAAWRTTFPILAGGPVQRVAPERRQLLALVDLSGLPAVRREAEALRRVGEDVAQNDLLLEEGTRIGPREIGLLAGVGRAQVRARVPMRVRVRVRV